jgi:hypothetical protein
LRGEKKGSSLENGSPPCWWRTATIAENASVIALIEIARI